MKTGVYWSAEFQARLHKPIRDRLKGTNEMAYANKQSNITGSWTVKKPFKQGNGCIEIGL